MNTRLLLAACVGVASLLSTQTSVANDTGFELTVSGISTQMDGTFSGPTTGDLTRVNNSTTGLALSGSWYFSPTWAVNLEYADHGSFDGFNLCPPGLFCIAADSPEVIDATTLTLSVIGEMPLSGNWSVFGRLGYADTDLDRRFAGDTDDQNVVAGLGLRHSFGQANHVALELRSEAADMDRVSLSWGHRF